jgi:phenylalanyl-tRNA synthetase alpha chain
MKNLGSMSPEERKTFGGALNVLKDKLTEIIVTKKAGLAEAELDRQLQSEAVDVTLPPVKPRLGTIHPVSQVMEELAQIFGEMGFALEEGPDIETDFNNFTALNFPPKHPARETHDTFFMNARDEKGECKVLRTHTSPVQVRTMLKQKPPIRMICMGRTFRKDSDATHTPMFHQIEGLVIDESAHMGHLKWILEEFCRALFEVPKVEMRLRPSHFPFTEPSAEVDIRCDRSGPEIKLGQGNDWLEILGCGMVHPKVIEMCGHDPNKYQGFAWGMGLDRLAMLKYGAPDLRAFFDADIRWLKHYGFASLDIPSLAGGLSR